MPINDVTRYAAGVISISCPYGLFERSVSSIS